MQDEFGKQIASVFNQWESDIQKSKDAEEKLEVSSFFFSFFEAFSINSLLFLYPSMKLRFTLILILQ